MPSFAPSAQGNLVFISYSHQDKEWLEKLRTTLKPLVRQESISVWDDTEIAPGAVRNQEIHQALSRAKIAILLVSADFLASDFIHEQELTPLLQAAADKGLRILWVYLSYCMYQETAIADYQAVHDITKPLKSLKETQQDLVWVNIGEQIKAIIKPTIKNTPQGQIQLEYPEGQVAFQSPFYVERPPIETNCYNAILNPGALIRIKAPQLMGKTSLISRILGYASEQEYHTVYLDFSSFGGKIFADLDLFLRWWCRRISRQLKIKDRLDEYWDLELLSSPSNCTDYFEEYLLPEIKQPLVLGLDEIDQIFPHRAVAEDFLGMLRSWHEKGKNMAVWRKLHLVVAHSTEVYIRLNINKSPFNVGLPMELPEFTSAQMADLAARHGLRWSETEINSLQTMVGGHPYLVRLAMYYVGNGEVSLPQLLSEAPTEAGIYRTHLRQCGENLMVDAQLVGAFKQVINSPSAIFLPPMQIYKLHSMGLVTKQGNQVKPRYQLYRDYFRQIL